MHLLYDARLLHRPLSGLERVQRNVLRELAVHPEIQQVRALVQAGAKVPTELPQNMELVEVASTEDILAVLLHRDEKQRPDVYHLTYFPDRNPRDVLLPLAARASVVEVHDAILNRHPEYHPDYSTWEWYHGFVCQLVRNCDRLLVHSRSVAGEVVRDLHGDGEIIDVAPLAVDPSLREALAVDQIEKRQRKLGIRSGPYFMALGKDYPHKDHETMFRAFAHLKESGEHEDLHIVCAGSKVWQGGRPTDELVRSLKIRADVTWVQNTSDVDIKALLQGALGLVYPSREEGFGLPPIEAMAVGTPVIAASAMSVPEVCGDGALLFEPGQVEELAGLMKMLIAGGAPVDALVERGRRRERGYSWKRCADATVASYKRAIATAESGRDTRVGEARLWDSLSLAARSPFHDAHELRAWQERCRGTERHARAVEASRDELLQKLQELERRHGEQVTQPPEDNGQPQPRWSLRRRLRKIRDGLRRGFSSK